VVARIVEHEADHLDLQQQQWLLVQHFQPIQSMQSWEKLLVVLVQVQVLAVEIALEFSRPVGHRPIIEWRLAAEVHLLLHCLRSQFPQTTPNRAWRAPRVQHTNRFRP
jgi:hypothetical protein